MSVEINAYINKALNESDYYGSDWLSLTNDSRQRVLIPKSGVTYTVLTKDKHYGLTFLWNGTEYVEKRAGYRSELSSMDKNTILFVRTNRQALAYNYNYYKANPSFVDKQFITDPPIRILFKVTDSYYSWVDFSEILEEVAGNKGLEDISILCVEAYRTSRHLINYKDGTSKFDIPAALYTDENGFEYCISMNDGNTEYTDKVLYSSRCDNGSDIIVSQCSINNPGLSDNKRHLMDDIKIELKYSEDTVSNSICTFNSIINPIIFDSNPSNKNIGYIKGALMKASLNSNSILSLSRSFPTSYVNKPAIIANSAYNCNTDVENYFFTTIDGKFYIFFKDDLGDWNLQRSNDCNIIATDDSEINPQPRTDFFENLNEPMVVSIPYAKNGINSLIAYSLTGSNVYYVTQNGGITWERKVISDLLGDNTITGFEVCNYTPLKTLIIKCNNDKYYSSSNGLSWTQIHFIKDKMGNDIIPNPSNDRKTIFKDFRIGMPWLRYYENTYIDADGYLYVHDNTGVWYKGQNVDIYTDYIQTHIKSKEAGSNAAFNDDNNKFEYKISHDKNSDITSIVFYFKFAYEESGVPEDIVIETHGIYKINVLTNEAISIDYNAYTLSNEEPVNNEPGEPGNSGLNLPDVFDGSSKPKIKFTSNNIMCYKNKWMVLNDYPSGEINGEPVYTYITTSDFITWTQGQVYDMDGLRIDGLKHTEGQGTFIAEVDNVNSNLPSYKTFIIPNDYNVYKYTIPQQSIPHYDLRVRLYKWRGINISQPITASYLVTPDNHISQTTVNAPIKIGFSFNINPKAFILLYNGVPMLDGDVYVNPRNNREIIIENAIKYHSLQTYINPIQFRLGKRAYVYSDFKVLNCTSADDTKECYMELDKGVPLYAGKCCYVNFHSDIKGDCILFNGVDHEYYITGKRSIKYLISRYGLNEAVYPEHRYMYVGNLNIRKDVSRNIVKIQFVLKDK